MNLRSITLALGAVLLAGCSKDGVQSITAPVNGAQVRFSNFAVVAPPATAVPAVNFFANDAKLTAITSGTGQESTLGTGTGLAGNSGLYSVLSPGAYTLTGRVAATTDNGLAIASLPVTLADGKRYSVYMSGYYNTTTKLTDAFMVEDVFPAEIDYSTALVRFVNASPTAPAYQLSARNPTTGAEIAVAVAAAYKSASGFARIPSGVYDLVFRGGSVDQTGLVKGASFLAGRVYTVTIYGDITVSSTTASNRPRVDLATNR